MARPEGDARAIEEAGEAVAVHARVMRVMAIEWYRFSSLKPPNDPDNAAKDRHIEDDAGVEGRPEGQAGETIGKGYNCSASIGYQLTSHE